jgi:hypothetical protein
VSNVPRWKRSGVCWADLFESEEILSWDCGNSNAAKPQSESPSAFASQRDWPWPCAEGPTAHAAVVH